MTPLEHDAGKGGARLSVHRQYFGPTRVVGEDVPSPDHVSIGEGVWALAGTILGLRAVAALMLWSVGQ
jgi:hypothetical protein